MRKTTSALSVAFLTAGSLVFSTTAMAEEDGEPFLAINKTEINAQSGPATVTADNDGVTGLTGCIVLTYSDFNAEDATAEEPVEEVLASTAFGGSNPAFEAFTQTVTWDAETMLGQEGNFWTWGAYFDVTCANVDEEDGPSDTVVLTITASEEESDVDAPGAFPAGALTVSNINPTLATVAWAAPVGGGDLDGYQVFLGDTKVKDVDADATRSVTLSGLTPDTNYTVTVKAVNAGGESSVSETFKTVATTKTGKIELAAKEGELIAGTKATITATGLKPEAAYTVVLKSDPVTLSSGTVPANGNISVEVTFPSGLPEGRHSLTLTSTNWDDTPLEVVVFFELDEDGRILTISSEAPELAETGLSLILPIGIAAALGAAGVGFVVAGARRRAMATVES